MEPELALGEENPANDLRARVREVLDRRKLTDSVSAEQAAASWEQDRFVARARALFYARMMFLTLGLLILAVPAWSGYFDLTGPLSFVGYFTMLLYSVANLLVIDHPRAGRWVTYLTLCFDLVITVVLIAKPQVGGGLQSPLLATQLLFTTLFAILFPKPLAILPPLLALPITTRLDLLLNRSVTAVELLTLLWYLALNFIIVYVLVYLNEREATAHREVVSLQGDLKELAVVEERNRLAREIHDGLGASLSSMIIQAEYILNLAGDEGMRSEIRELKATAEESIEELRRNLRMMREDFELDQGLGDYVTTFTERTGLDIRFERTGASRKLPPDAQLALFRILQECLSNAVKHAEARKVLVRLDFGEARVDLIVRDDGKGFDPSRTPRGHYGLLNMRERAMKLGGSLIVDSAPGAGAQVAFSLPCTLD
ncbi:sensor histidine kinase [Corallococcus sp. H22C18031201]|uniref:sensor histidine kinase n=1 Tax=Citreicoccus inhibens TaxID=2849499 RepID=UPI000E70A1B8|nr:sensor histidine kinase [Citreicoccus inhibens]MBU8894516.1 sensor histidine kinase [Citreicoccus inhibens]RJS25114.1 sensor histidine kinase [Corallococcus sp. H22C18031201]